MASSGVPSSQNRYPAGRLAFPHRDLTGIAQLERHEILFLLDEAEQWVELNRRRNKHHDALAGLTIINAFFIGCFPECILLFTEFLKGVPSWNYFGKKVENNDALLKYPQSFRLCNWLGTNPHNTRITNF